MSREIRQAAERVVARSRRVRIDRGRLRDYVPTLPQTVPDWWDGVDADAHFCDGTERTLMYLLLLDAVNFCFWPSHFEVEFRGRVYGRDDGYLALVAALTRAFEEGVPLWEASFLRRLSAEDLRHVLRCQGEVPLFEERLRHLRDIGEVLTAEFGGEASALLETAGGDAPRLARLLADRFVAYRDTRTYQGERFDVLKRAQLCASDIIGCFRGSGYGALTGAEELTCFADYKLPQLFHSLGIFEYDPELDRAIRAGRTIVAGSQEEVEIRANTIVVVEHLKSLLQERGVEIASRELDWILWNESVRPGAVTVPHHRTVTTAY